jgi:Xaa-Pro aminopeptidase
MFMPFNEDEYRQRLAAVRRAFTAAGLEAILVTLPDALHWLTGYDTIGYLWTQALVIGAEGEPRFITRTSEEPGFNETSILTGARFYDIATEDVVDVIADTVRDLGLDSAQLGVELQAFTFLPAQWDRLRERLPDAGWRDTTWLVAEARLVKSPTELAYQRQAAEMADSAMRAALEALRPGVSEVEVAGIAAKALGDAGSEYAAIPPMCASGRRSALVHTMPRRVAIARGDVVCIELGAAVNRYHAIVMRTAVIGSPSDRLRDVHDCTREGLEAAIGAAGPGAHAHEPDDACNAVLERLDLVRRRCHRIGYSLGVAYPPGWLEPMTLVAGDDHVLAPGMSFSLEPNLALQDEGFGIKLGETVACTAGGAVSLSRLDHELAVID